MCGPGPAAFVRAQVHDTHNIAFASKAWKVAATDLNQVRPAVCGAGEWDRSCARAHLSDTRATPERAGVCAPEQHLPEQHLPEQHLPEQHLPERACVCTRAPERHLSAHLSNTYLSERVCARAHLSNT